MPEPTPFRASIETANRERDALPNVYADMADLGLTDADRQALYTIARALSGRAIRKLQDLPPDDHVEGLAAYLASAFVNGLRTGRALEREHRAAA